MSLSGKPMNEIDFADIDAFCKTMEPEGSRLDYKDIALPKGLVKTIVAFANMLGRLNSTGC